MPFVPPMLATPAREEGVPEGADWVHEIKWDGMRVIADVTPTGVRLYSRPGNDVTARCPALAGLAALGHTMVLDGELAAVGEDRRPTFGNLQTGRGQVKYFIFDVVELDGADLRALPWTERRRLLESLHLGDDAWLVPPTYDDGEMLLEATRQQGLEGIVSKRRSSPYAAGLRSRDWLKFPHRPRLSWVIGGWRPEKDSPGRLGSVLVGEPLPGGGLLFRGRVGSGLGGKAGPVLKALLEPLARPDSPFRDGVPRLDALGTRWVEPVVVVDVESLGFSGGGRLRQPSYQGVRADLTPDDVIGEAGR